MKVCAVSDTHMQHVDLVMPEADILIHAGDGTDHGTVDEMIRLNTWFKYLKPRYKHIIYVPGNHDLEIESDPDFSREMMSACNILIDQPYDADGVKIYGSPWTVTFGWWAFMKPDLNLSNHWENIPSDTDILVTHGPPYGILDKNSRGALCGSQTLMKAVLDKRPKHHVFGHIHEEGEKSYYIEPTKYHNVATIGYWSGSDYVERNPTTFEV